MTAEPCNIDESFEYIHICIPVSLSPCTCTYQCQSHSGNIPTYQCYSQSIHTCAYAICTQHIHLHTYATLALPMHVHIYVTHTIHLCHYHSVHIYVSRVTPTTSNWMHGKLGCADERQSEFRGVSGGPDGAIGLITERLTCPCSSTDQTLSVSHTYLTKKEGGSKGFRDRESIGEGHILSLLIAWMGLWRNHTLSR